MAKSKTSLYDSLYPRMKAQMSQPKNQQALKMVFNEMLSRNNEALASAIPDKPVYMDRKTEKKYYEIIGVTPDDIVNAVNNASYIGEDWNTIRNPMYVSLLILVFLFKDLKKEQMAEQSVFMFSLYMYRNVRSKYYSRISQSTINIMNYTISRLSYKSDLKKHGSILKMIAKKNSSLMENWWGVRKKDVQLPFTDEIICKIVNDNYRRYSTTLNNFYAEFKKDSLSGNYINTDKDVDEEDEFLQSDNVSFLVEKHTQALMGKYSLSRYPDGTIIKHACAMEQGCSINHLRNLMNFIYDGKDKEFEELIRLILQTYLFEFKKPFDSIKSYDFLIVMKGYYKKQTTQDPNLTQIKEILEGFIQQSGITKKVSKPSTLNDFKKAIFLFFLVFIQRNI